MFRNNKDFDEVASYRREQERAKTKDRFDQENRFDRRDDYEYDENFGKEDDTYSDREYQAPPSPRPPRTPSKIRTLLVTMVAIIAISGIFGNLVRGCTNIFFSDDHPQEETTTSEVSESDGNAGDVPLMKVQAMDAGEFIKEYEKAQKNKIKFDRLSRDYLSGDYNKSFSLIERYITREYQDDYQTTFLCLSKQNKKTYKFQPLRCAQEVSQFSDLKYPSDFVAAAEKEGLRLYDYQIYNSDSNIVYFINGRVYTQELVDLIIDWSENGNFN